MTCGIDCNEGCPFPRIPRQALLSLFSQLFHRTCRFYPAERLPWIITLQDDLINQSLLWTGLWKLLLGVPRLPRVTPGLVEGINTPSITLSRTSGLCRAQESQLVLFMPKLECTLIWSSSVKVVVESFWSFSLSMCRVQSGSIFLQQTLMCLISTPSSRPLCGFLSTRVIYLVDVLHIWSKLHWRCFFNWLHALKFSLSCLLKL